VRWWKGKPSRSCGLKGPAALLVASIAPVIFE
jgi:hypothetical protein